MIKTYYQLVKPGIIRGNLVTTTAGFLLASQGDVDTSLLLALLAGTSLVIACGCVLNNYLDRGIDKKMARTKKRALVTGAISTRNALVYAAVLGVLGTAVLLIRVNVLTTLIGLFGLFAYVVLYGIAKRRTVHGTLVGTISVAIPPVAGYTAVTNNIDFAALSLFFILVFWQMPHFYAIALYRLKEYKAAGIPVMPLEKGVANTTLQMLLYIVAFICATTWLTLFGYLNAVYMVIALLLGLIWAVCWFKDSTDINHWARQMFLISLIVITGLSVAISVDSFFV